MLLLMLLLPLLTLLLLLLLLLPLLTLLLLLLLLLLPLLTLLLLLLLLLLVVACCCNSHRSQSIRASAGSVWLLLWPPCSLLETPQRNQPEPVLAVSGSSAAYPTKESVSLYVGGAQRNTKTEPARALLLLLICVCSCCCVQPSSPFVRLCAPPPPTQSPLTYAHACARARAHANAHTQTRTRRRTRTHAHAHTHTRTHARGRARRRARARTHTHTHACTHVHARARAHARTRARAQATDPRVRRVLMAWRAGSGPFLSRFLFHGKKAICRERSPRNSNGRFLIAVFNRSHARSNLFRLLVSRSRTNCVRIKQGGRCRNNVGVGLLRCPDAPSVRVGGRCAICGWLAAGRGLHCGGGGGGWRSFHGSECGRRCCVRPLAWPLLVLWLT